MTKNYVESLENISVNFDKVKDEIYMKEKLYQFKELDKININFKDCLVAICPNGGLIAICKKKNYLDLNKKSKINNNIIVMYQTCKIKYFIPIDWNYKDKYFILLDFNEKEQLYGICNNGSIFKIDILTQKAVEKVTPPIFLKENIVKAKLFEDGFVALTTYGNFYYIKDIKNPNAELFLDMKSLLHFSNNVEFLVIPASVSKSKNIELLITNEKGHGIIHVEKTEDAKYYIVPLDNNSEIFMYKGISILKKDKLEPFLLNQENINDISSIDKKSQENQESQYQHENLRKIGAMAISPSKKNIALYDTRGVVFFFNSSFDLDINKNPRIKSEIKMSEDLSPNEIVEQQVVINYQEGFQFLFCGEDTVILSGLSLIFIINKSNGFTFYKIDEMNENDILKGKMFMKCVSEVDGIRYLTNEGIFFISKVCNELYNVSEPFSKSNDKMLVKSYFKYINKSVDSEKSLREIGNLEKAVNEVLIAAGNIFWAGDPPDEENYEKKEVQLFILKAAQHGKNFLKIDDFNYDKFLETCKDIRVVNNLRTHSTMPRLITFNEYKNMDSKDLIKKTMRLLNFGLAFEICHYLDYSDKKVYQRYAISKIKKLPFMASPDKEEKIFEILNEKLKNVKNLSFIKLAKKAFKYHKNNIGMKFLEKEKSVLSKIPQYLELNNWDKALELAQNVYDFNVINIVIYKIFKTEKINDFISTVQRHPEAKPIVIQFLQRNAPKIIASYLNKINNPEELFFFYIEQYFQTEYISERKKYISLAKEKLKLIDNTVNPNFEHKFYKNYIETLESNLIIKTEPKNINIISNPEKVSFDISMYDFYKIEMKELENEKTSLIDTQNKSIGFSESGINMMKLIAFCENKKYYEMEYLIKKNIKKLGLTYLNLSEIYYNFKIYDEATKYIKLITDPRYITYKIQMLEYINNYEAEIEVIISDKNIDNMNTLINNIIKKKPELKEKVEELCNKYKVKFN